MAMVTLDVNNFRYSVLVKPYDLLAGVLRDKLGLLGTKMGCDFGGCGCCTVIVEGDAVYSCMTPIHKVIGKKIRTIEGLGKSGLDPVQKAFMDNFGFQCGYCTPGFIMSTVAMLEKTPDPSEDHIREYLSGNLCRCTGYTNIFRSVKAVAKTYRPVAENVKEDSDH